MAQKIKLKNGLNVWRLLATSVDNPDKSEVAERVPLAVDYFIEQQPFVHAPVHMMKARDGEWRFGNVRPLKLLSIGTTPPEMPRGEFIADRGSVIGISPNVATSPGHGPWWLLVELWWRGPDIEIDYPGVRQFGFMREYTLSGADWLLDTAIFIPHEAAPVDPGEESLPGSIVGSAKDRARETARGLRGIVSGYIATQAVGGALVMLGAYLFLRGRNNGTA